MTNGEVQQPLFRSPNVSGRHVSPIRLGRLQQFRKSIHPTPSESTVKDNSTKSYSYDNSTRLEGPSVAQYSVEVINPTKIKIVKQQRNAARASKESKVELLCLEDICQKTLLNSGWSNVAASQVKIMLDE